MKNLKEQKCVACTIDAPLVDEAEYSPLMSNLPDWEIEKEEINKLVKVYAFSNYQDSINFAKERMLTKTPKKRANKKFPFTFSQTYFIPFSLRLVIRLKLK